MNITPAMLNAYHRDQTQAIALMETILGQMRHGLTEMDIVQMFEQQHTMFGFQGFIRRPVVHIDYRPSFRFGPSPNRFLKRGSVVQLHIQPYSNDAFGNIGLSFVFEAPDLPIVTVARDLCVATSTFAGHTKKAGELIVFAESWATNNRTSLNKDSIGHVCVPNTQQGLIHYTWPKSMRYLSQLRRFQIQWFNPRPLNGIYALHPDIQQDNRRAGFAELILVTPEQRLVLGRNSIDDLCTFNNIPSTPTL